MTILVGICGLKGSGKSTVAQEFARSTDKSVKIIPLGGPLKKMVASLGVPVEAIYGSDEDKNKPQEILCGKSARVAQQTLGTEWGRDMIGEDIWLNAWQHQVDLSYADIIICDDMRFPNEFDSITAQGGITIRIESDRVPNTGDLHRSEKYALKFDVDSVIDNSGTIDESVQLLMDIINDQ